MTRSLICAIVVFLLLLGYVPSASAGTDEVIDLVFRLAEDPPCIELVAHGDCTGAPNRTIRQVMCFVRDPGPHPSC